MFLNDLLGDAAHLLRLTARLLTLLTLSSGSGSVCGPVARHAGRLRLQSGESLSGGRQLLVETGNHPTGRVVLVESVAQLLPCGLNRKTSLDLLFL